MLEELVVDGLGAIEHAEVTFDAGSSALTGETGAGKTLLVAAVGLLRGERADRSRIREGAAEALVEGRFRIPVHHPAALALAEQELVPPSTDDIEIVVTRSIPVSGSARARINGRLVTASVLNEVAGLLVEIAGQNEHQRMSSPSAQRDMLDAFAGPDVVRLAREVRAAVRDAASATRELKELEAGEREREREIDVLRYEIREIEAVAPSLGESERLQAEAARLENATAIASALQDAASALKSDDGAIDGTDRALARLGDAAALDPAIAEVRSRLEGVVHELTDIGGALASMDVETDPAARDRVLDRLGELGRLKRKYGPDETAVDDYLAGARERLARLEIASDSRERLGVRAADATQRAQELAGRLSDVRRSAAEALQDQIVPLLEELALSGARFEIALEGCELYEGGFEKIEFKVAANPGETPRSIARVASGGELSRIALALHVLTGSEGVPTLVFDEVDAGVGGEAAQSVGRAIARLATERNAQVLVVTHLPQVAAWADVQYRVAKDTARGRADVSVQRVEGAERVEELSRMLAGLPESEKAKQHAEELLEIAGRAR